jgi:hypothetical protein
VITKEKLIHETRGCSLGDIWQDTPEYAEKQLTHAEHIHAFIIFLRLLMEESCLLIDFRIDNKNLPWGTVQTDMLDWFKSNLPEPDLLQDGSWWILVGRPDRQYAGACIWRAAANNGTDVWV